MSSRRVYTDAFKASVLAMLAMNEGNVKRTVRDVAELYGEDVPVSTVRAWSKGRGTKSVSDGSVSLKKGEIEMGFSRALGMIFEHGLDERKIKATSFKDLMTAAGIAVDKILVLRGEATEISEQRRGHQVRINWGDGAED